MSMEKPDQGGPGWRRMKARLGPEKMEATRLLVLAEQEAALAGARALPAPAKTDRGGYSGYPPPRPRRK